MGELLKFMIEQLKGRRWGTEALLLAAVLVLCFSVAFYFQTKPEASAVLHDLYFQASAILFSSLWMASICWRHLIFKALRLISTGTILLVGFFTSYQVFFSTLVPQLRIVVVFDDSITVPPVAMNQFIRRLRSPLFDLEVDDRPLHISGGTLGTISSNEAREALANAGIPSTPNRGVASLTVLVTTRNLRNNEWAQNLLATTGPDRVVISAWDIGASTSLADDVVGRYVATSVALETLTAYALRHDEYILKDRTPGMNRGCLWDFHRTRQTYVIQSQKPELCDAEAEGIRRIFGDGAVKEIRAVLKAIPSNSR